MNKYGNYPNPDVDEQGNELCIYCGHVLEGLRQKYCRDKCANDYYATYDWGFFRYKMIEKSNFTCAKCSFHVEGGSYESYTHFVADHIIPRALGGAYLDESNIQILCKHCNKTKTSKDLRNIAKFRRDKKNKEGKDLKIDVWV